MYKLYQIGHFLLTLFLIEAVAVGQDPQFSQFYANPLYLAPSFAGGAEATRISINYRDQWPGLSGHFVSYSFSADHYFEGYNSGLGVLMVRDQAGGGKLNKTNIGLIYSYRLKINNRYSLQPGLQAYYTFQNINFNKLTFSDQFSGDRFFGSSVETPPEERVSHPDFTVSLLGYFDYAWIGFSVDHLMKLNNTLEQDSKYEPLKYSLFGGAKIMIKKRFQAKDSESLKIAFNLRQQAQLTQLDMGMYYLKNPFLVGVWYRGVPLFKNIVSHDAITILLGYKFESLSFGYSYDFTVGKLINKTGGAHEVSIIYIFDQSQLSNRKKKHGSLPCPSI